MGEGTPIDSLQVEIEASSSKAADEVTALTKALEGLKKAVSGDFGGITNKIKSIGEAAENAMPKATREKKQALKSATSTTKVPAVDVSGVVPNAEIDSATEKLNELKDAVQNVNETKLEIPTLAETGTTEIKSVTDSVEKLGDVIEDTSQKSRVNDIGENLVSADEVTEIMSLIKSGENLKDTIDNINKEEIKPTVDDKGLLDLKSLLDGVDSKSLKIDLKGEDVNQLSDVKKQIEDLGYTIEKVTTSTKDGAVSGVSVFAKSTKDVDSIKDSIDALLDKFNALKLIAPDVFGPLESSIKKVSDSLKGIKMIEDTKSSLSGVASAASEIGSATGGIESAATALGGMEGAATGAAGAATGLAGALGPIGIAIAAIAGIASVVLPKIVDAMKEIGSITGVVVNKLKEMVPAAKAAIKALAVGTIKKFGEGIKTVGSFLKSKFIGPFENAINKVKKWKQMMASALFYNVFFKAMNLMTTSIKEGIENLYYYSQIVGTEFAPAMDSLATSALYLKNSLGAMAAPLIQALAPAIDFIIDKFVALLNVIGKVFAVLTGKGTYTQAVKTTTKWGDALDDAAGSAKEFQRYLMGIDELNIMQEPSSGGSGAGAGADFGSMFEEVEVPTEISDWANEIRLAIEAGDWRSVGELLAKKLNEIIDAWDSYAWGVKLGNLINNGLNIAYGFLTTFDFEKFGAKIADLFNGMFDTIDWDLLGRTIAAGWNGLFNFVYGFATTLKWKDIGLDIATAINGFLDEINLVRAAEAISAFVVGVFDLFNTTIAETNWDVLGTKLGEFLNNIDWYGIVNGVLSIITNALAALKLGVDSFLATWDWKKQADDIARAINDAFASVDWRGLGESLGNAFITAFNFLRETISKIDWRQIGVDIANFILGINWVELLGGLSGLLADAINAAVSLVSGLLDTLGPNLQSIAEGIAQKINEFVQTVDWEKLGQTIHDGIKMALDFLITVMDNLDWEAIGNAIGDFLEALDWGDILSTWGEVLGTAIGGVLEAIDVGELLNVGMNIAGGLFEGMLKKFDEEGGIGGWIEKNFVLLLIDGLKSLLGIASPSTVMRDDVGVYISEGILEGIKLGWPNIPEFFSTAIEDVKTTLGNAWESIKENASTAWETIKIELGTTWDNIKEAAGTKFEEIKTKIGDVWENVKSNTSEKWENIKTSLGEKWSTIKENASTKFTEIKESISEKWENMKSDASEKWNTIQDTLSTAWDNVKTTAIEKFEDVKSGIANVWSNIKETAKTWGSDICSGIASGIEGAKNFVTSAVSGIASGIKSFLHFSEPDVGPLSDFHTYMPDMMNLMAKGIKDNSHLAVNAVSDVSSEMSNAFNSISAKDMEFPIHEEMYSHITADVANSNAQTTNSGDAFGENMRVANGDVVSAIMAAAAQIVAAVNENGDRPINLDMGKVSSAVTTTQNRQNKMYGKTLSNG